MHISLKYARKFIDFSQIRASATDAYDDTTPTPLQRLSDDWHLPEHMNTNMQPKQLPDKEPPNPLNAIQLQLTDHRAAHTGTLIHEILQRIAEQGLAEWDQQRITQQQTYWLARLQQLGLDAAIAEQQLPQVTQAISNAIGDDRGRWILQAHPDAACEYAITTQHDNKTQQLIIDRTFVEDDIRWIIDYKSAQPGELPLTEFLQLEKAKYHAQLEIYANALAHLDGRDIQLGLYFPLCGGWLAWPANLELTLTTSVDSSW